MFRMKWQSHSYIVGKLENFFSREALNALSILSIYLFRMQLRENTYTEKLSAIRVVKFTSPSIIQMLKGVMWICKSLDVENNSVLVWESHSDKGIND